MYFIKIFYFHPDYSFLYWQVLTWNLVLSTTLQEHSSHFSRRWSCWPPSSWRSTGGPCSTFRSGLCTPSIPAWDCSTFHTRCRTTFATWSVCAGPTFLWTPPRRWWRTGGRWCVRWTLPLERLWRTWPFFCPQIRLTLARIRLIRYIDFITYYRIFVGLGGGD